MEIRLDPQQGFIKNGKFDQREALINAGVKAAVCFKEPKDGEVITPWDIRKESENSLIVRGLNTIFSDHTTPTEHAHVGLEITGIPKILCMILNNEHQYTTCERSLRYTEVEPNDYLTSEEVENYNKWLDIFEKVITHNYSDFYEKHYGKDRVKPMIHKLAQENARYQVSVFMPTTLTYTVPFIQINKVCTYMNRVIEKPLNELEELLVPYFKEFIDKLRDLKVLITKNALLELCDNDTYQKLCKNNPRINSLMNDDLLYVNNKSIDLSLFSERNNFSGIDLPNQYGVNISHNHFESFACLAQEHRHRTVDCEMKLLEDFKYYIPPIILNNPSLCLEWGSDMEKVKKSYPQGQIVKVNTSGSLKNIINFVSKERCCDRAQCEIENLYANEIIPDIYENLELTGQTQLQEELKPYVKKLRCAYPTYNCPKKCGHPRLKRDL